MKKLLSILFLFFVFTSLKVNAEVIPHTVYAVTPADISNQNLETNREIELISVDEYNFDNVIHINKGDKIKIKIDAYVQPSRGKRNGYFKVYYVAEDKEYSAKMRESTPKDLKSIAESAGVAVVGHVLKIPGLSQAAALSKGLLKPNENQGRLKSAGKNLYESTPLTYVEKGKDFSVEKDGVVAIKIKIGSGDED